MKHAKTLFILKKNETYGFHHYCRRSSGLWNSINFIVKDLKERGVHCHIEEVQDNNCIDRVVSQFKPDIVVIEALWVVPEKFDVLKKLHPKVRWFVRLHSHMPFLALEGIAMEWIEGYFKRGLGVIANSEPMFDALYPISPKGKLLYLPNVYRAEKKQYGQRKHFGSQLNIGCFGAVRPLKNQLIQALAAIQFAKELNAPLCFFINGSRVETGGDPVLKNIKALFAGRENSHLILCDWAEHEDFIDLIRDMDISMQVSLTETFSIVSADSVTAGVPLVTSKEVEWASPSCKARDNDINDIVKKMKKVYKNNRLVCKNKMLLDKASDRASQLWFKFIRS